MLSTKNNINAVHITAISLHARQQRYKFVDERIAETLLIY